MSVLNKSVKGVANLITHIGVAIYLYLMSMLITSPILTVTLMIISIVTKTLPDCVITKFWLVFLISAIPLWIVLAIALISDRKKENTKK